MLGRANGGSKTMTRLDVKAARELRPGQVLKDHVVRGLQLHGTTSGASWKLYYRSADGKQRKPKLGDFPALTLELARAAARTVLAGIAAGDDPAAKRERDASAARVSDLCARYLARPRSQRTQAEYERNIRLHILPALGDRIVADVTKADVHRLFDGMTAGGKPIAANRVLDVLSGLFRLAESGALEWRPPNSNPTHGIEKNPERQRRVHLAAESFAAVGAALHDLSARYPAHVAAILIMIYSGTRVTELVTAPRSALRGRMIVLEEHKTARTGEPRVIHLSEQAAKLLAALPDDRSGLLFGRLDRYAVFRVWEMARGKAGVPDVQVRDLRRTFASVALSRVGASLDQTGQLLGHADPSTTRGYAWLMTDAAQQLTQQTADSVDELMKPHSKSS